MGHILPAVRLKTHVFATEDMTTRSLAPSEEDVASPNALGSSRVFPPADCNRSLSTGVRDLPRLEIYQLAVASAMLFSWRNVRISANKTTNVSVRLASLAD